MIGTPLSKVNNRSQQAVHNPVSGVHEPGYELF
ncbi:hypothetical protein SAMN05428962_4709 [Paenibacillus sp. BC26]|nr:hypothetical protein SAMN05428962_4709 [Paenibacillus sp. BC26]